MIIIVIFNPVHSVLLFRTKILILNVKFQLVFYSLALFDELFSILESVIFDNWINEKHGSTRLNFIINKFNYCFIIFFLKIVHINFFVKITAETFATLNVLFFHISELQEFFTLNFYLTTFSLWFVFRICLLYIFLNLLFFLYLLSTLKRFNNWLVNLPTSFHCSRLLFSIKFVFFGDYSEVLGIYAS